MSAKARPITDTERRFVIDTYRQLGTINGTTRVTGIGWRKVSQIMRESGIDYSRPNRTNRSGTKPRQAGLGRTPVSEEWSYLAGCFDAMGRMRSENRTHDSLLINCPTITHAKTIQAMVGAGKTHARQNSETAEFRLYGAKEIVEFLDGIAPHVRAKRNLVRRAVAEMRGYLPSNDRLNQPHESASLSW